MVLIKLWLNFRSMFWDSITPRLNVVWMLFYYYDDDDDDDVNVIYN